MLRGLNSVSKQERYENPLVSTYRKAVDKKNEQQMTLQLKRRRRGKQSLHIEPTDISLEQTSFEISKRDRVRLENEHPAAKKEKPGSTEKNGRLTRLASSLKKPTRLEYFIQQEERATVEIAKVQSNQNFEQATYVHKRYTSTNRAQARFLSTMKNKEKISMKAKTEGEEVRPGGNTYMEEPVFVDYRRRSPD